jgi:SAM-dependent methyltransferase
MKHIHLDEPRDLAAVTHSQVFQGWSVSFDPQDAVSVTVNGSSIVTFEITRADVKKEFPNLHAKGWMFFFRPDDALKAYVISLKMAEITRELRFTISDDVVEMAKVAKLTRQQHLEFLDTVLVCPMCHAACSNLSEFIEKEWQCTNCDERYNCTTGLNLIPKSYENYDAIQFNGAIFSHGYDRDVERLIDEVSAGGGMVLDCGAGWRHLLREHVVTTEILQYPSTDVVAVSEHLPFRDGAFDAVLSLHVLEHVKNPFVCAAELMRVLKPNGRFHAVIPYIAAVHGAPFHFFNPTPQGLLALFENFAYDTNVSVPANGHPIVALKELLNVCFFFLEQPSLKELSNRTLGEFAAMSTAEILKCDFVAGFRKEGMMRLSGNYMITGRRT